MPYIGKSPSAGIRQRYQYTATAGQTTFSGTDLGNLTLTYTDNNFVDVFQNGVLLKGGGTDYTATSGTSVVLTTGASVSDVIEIIVYDVFSVGNFYNRTDSDSRYLNVAGDTMTGSLDLNGTELVLDVDGDTSITSDTDDQVDIKLGGNDQVVVATGSTAFKAPDGGSRYLLGGTGNSDSAELSLYNSSDAQKTRVGASVDSFFIDSNIIVGATSFTNGADVVSIHADQGSTGHNIKCSRDSTSTKNQIEFYNPNNKVGAIQTSGSNTSYGTSSDYRLKENIVTDWDATTRLKQLKPSRFNFIADADTTVDGFIAHEVSSIVPEAITGEKDAVDEDGNIEAQNIDQSKLVPLLTKALQEAISEIDTLKEKVTALESK